MVDHSKHLRSILWAVFVCMSNVSVVAVDVPKPVVDTPSIVFALPYMRCVMLCLGCSNSNLIWMSKLCTIEDELHMALACKR